VQVKRSALAHRRQEGKLGKLHRIVSYLIVALGVAHILYTARVYNRFTLGAFWFIGSGIGIVYAGFLNLVFLKIGGRDRLVWTFCLLANLVSVALFVVGWFLIGEPQVLVGILLFACALIATLVSNRTTANEAT
jgi:hypothetical protein